VCGSESVTKPRRQLLARDAWRMRTRHDRVSAHNSSLNHAFACPFGPLFFPFLPVTISVGALQLHAYILGATYIYKTVRSSHQIDTHIGLLMAKNPIHSHPYPNLITLISIPHPTKNTRRKLNPTHPITLLIPNQPVIGWKPMENPWVFPTLGKYNLKITF
jgi:hypothetical protein